MFTHWQEFITVVEQESLNRASRLLNISQPALSRKMMKLEEELGVALFERKGKRLELTRVGQLCYEYALEFRSVHRQFQETLLRHKSVKKSSITIGASLTTLQSTLPDLIAVYSSEYPETDIKALTGKTHEIVTLVRDKKVDLGLVASRIDSPGLTCVPLFDDHLCLVLPKGHHLAMTIEEELSMRQLHGLPMILFSKGTWYRILMDELFHRYAILPDVKMEIDSFEAIIRLVSTTQVATMLPKSYLRTQWTEYNELVVKEIPDLARTKRTTSLVYTNAEELSASARQMLEKAQSYFAARA
jgi:LysR family transcriptional regulator, transcriptional activator of the cysJI operon